jgi:hypothetical protein
LGNSEIKISSNKKDFSQVSFNLIDMVSEDGFNYNDMNEFESADKREYLLKTHQAIEGRK